MSNTHLWTHFITPTFERRRFDTPFYLCILPAAGADAVVRSSLCDNHEATELQWLTPQDTLAGFASNAMSLPPPQVWTSGRGRRGRVHSDGDGDIARCGLQT